MRFVLLLFFFGLATGVVAKIKGSSFFLWFLVGFCLPGIGLMAAMLYRWEGDEPHRRCPRCGAVRPIPTRSAPSAARTWTGLRADQGLRG